MSAGFRPQSLRTGRSLRNRRESEDEIVHLDFTKDVHVNVRDVLCNVVKREGVSKAKKLGYLNAFVKLLETPPSIASFGYNADELFCCLRLSLFHDAKEVCAAGLRAMRYLLYDESMFDSFVRVQGHHLVCRSMDIALDNQIERLQALRLIRKVLAMCPHKFPIAFVRCLLAIARNSKVKNDRLLRAVLATLSELTLLNTELCTASGVVGHLMLCSLRCQLPRINEALVAIVLFFMNHPSTRHHVKMGVDLEQVLALYTDCQYKPVVKGQDCSTDKEAMFIPSKLALLSILRSWPGMIRLCKPHDSGLKSLVNILYIPNVDKRKGVMELLLDLFRLPIPEWTDDFATALTASDPSHMIDSWKLYEGFVAEEGLSILPHIAEYRTNLIENYLALLLLAFINSGILEALVEVIITSDKFLSVRATVVLGELLHLANRLLPHECSNHSQCLPTLVVIAASFEVTPQQRHIASAAVTYLNRLHSLKKRGPVPCSLFLDQLMQFSPKMEELKNHGKVPQPKLQACLRKDTDDFIGQSIKDSQVTNFSKEYNDWDWMLIDSLLKTSGDSFRKLADVNQKLFIRRLIYFYKPTSKQYSRLENGRKLSRLISLVGCHLMDFLVEADEGEAMKFLEEILTDLGLCISQITAERSTLDAILSPNKIMNSCCQDYFLFIGRLCHSRKGRRALEKANMFQYLLELVSVSTHDCYNKLIVSSLDYSKDGLPRIILTKILTATSENSRLYTTSFLRVLVRLALPEFHKWGIELLVSQLYDKSRAVSLAALDVLDEACECTVNLEAIINLRPSLLHLGDRGLLLLIRFLSLPSGFKFLSDANFVANEMERWRKKYNLKYVKIVEDELNDSLTRHQRGKDGTYGRRTSQRHIIRDVYIPHHLYGQLVQHSGGIELIKEQNILLPLLERITQDNLDLYDDVLELKAALWAMGHIGSSESGVELLNDGHVIPEIVKLAEECPVYSVRGTCFYVLGLLAATRAGADLLGQLGWEALRHRRSESWPLVEEPDLLLYGFDHDSLSSAGGSVAADCDLDDLDDYGVQADDSCSTSKLLLARLDEEEAPMPTRRRANFVLCEFDENDDVGTRASSEMESRDGDFEEFRQADGSEVQSRCASPISRDENGEEVVLRRGGSAGGRRTPEVNHNKQSPSLSSSTSSGQFQRGSSYHKWSHTLPLMRARPSTIAEMSAAAAADTSDEDVGSRQRSRSVSQRPPRVPDSAVQSWEHRARLSPAASEGGHSYFGCSPRGSSRLRLKIAVGAKTRSRSKSFTESFGGEGGGDHHILGPAVGATTAYRMQRNLRSSSNVDIGTHLRISCPLNSAGVGSGLHSPCVHVNGGGVNNGAQHAADFGDTVCGGGNSATGGFKEKRSDSNESSRASASTATSKSRSDSCCTDSTSGICSSSESTYARPAMLGVCGGISERSVQLLSPIASNSSLATTLSGRTVHHSDSTRKLVNLRQTPVVLHRVSAPLNLFAASSASSVSSSMSGGVGGGGGGGGGGGSALRYSNSSHSPDPQSHETSFVYTTTRDAQGYATLRSLQQRRRGYSTCVPPDPKMLEYEMRGFKTRSLDSRLELPRLLTYDSLSSLGLSYFERQPSISHSTSTHQTKLEKEDVRYIGLCLPVDIGMILNEDSKENRSEKVDLASSSDKCSEVPSLASIPHYMDRDPNFNEHVDDGLDSHEASMCLACFRVRPRENKPGNSENQASLEHSSSLQRLSPSPVLPTKESPCLITKAFNAKSQVNSSEASAATTPGSFISVESCETGGKWKNDDSLSNKALVRKEVIRILITLSCSVAHKSVEQNLLILKQKFPRAFQDLCLYSEVLHMLGKFPFKLKVRRFIQELFLDMTFSEMYEEPMQLLGLFLMHTDESNV